MKPSDGEVEFLGAVELRLGAGTRARIARIKATQRDGGTEIVATLEVRATVLICNPEAARHKCGACDAPAPAPDDDGLWYILQNHDGGRIVFPAPEAEAYAEPERDQYPAPGWRMVGDKVVCGDCWDVAQKALKSRRKRP